MKDKILKSQSLIDEYKYNSWYYYIISLDSSINDLDQQKYSTLFKRSHFLKNDKNIDIAIILNKDILFDDDVYYFGGAHSFNVKKILYQKDMMSYIKKLDVDDNLKNGLLKYVTQYFIENGQTRKIQLTELDESSYFNFLGSIDINKYLSGICFKYKEDYSEVKQKILKIFITLTKR
jgi:hypothetical protein